MPVLCRCRANLFFWVWVGGVQLERLRLQLSRQRHPRRPRLKLGIEGGFALIALNLSACLGAVLAFLPVARCCASVKFLIIHGVLSEKNNGHRAGERHDENNEEINGRFDQRCVLRLLASRGCLQ